MVPKLALWATTLKSGTVIEILDITLVSTFRSTAKSEKFHDELRVPQMCLLITKDLMELGKDRVGDDMQWMRPDLQVAFDGILTVLVIIFGAWGVDIQMRVLRDYETDYGEYSTASTTSQALKSVM